MQKLQKEIDRLKEELLLLPQKTCEEITLQAGLSPCFVRFCNWGLVVFPRSQFEYSRTSRYVHLLYKNHAKNTKMIERLVQVFDTCVLREGRSDAELVRRTRAVLPGRIESGDLNRRIEKATPAELLQCLTAGAYWLIKISDDLGETPFPRIKIGDGDVTAMLSSKEVQETMMRSRGFVLEK